MSTSDLPMSKEDIALAAGVMPQAVSNWERRHADFPRPVAHGAGYPATAVAAWLDGRVIQRTALRPGERHGQSYGQRFRAAAGLPAPLAPGGSTDVPTVGLLEEQLWLPLERLLRKGEDPLLFESVVMSLLCLRGTDPASWAVLRRATTGTIEGLVLQVVQRQPADVAKAMRALCEACTSFWRRQQLRDTIGVLAANRTPAAHAFDYLLDRFAEQRHSSPDEYLIPAELASLMVRMLDPEPGSRVYDPCCGSGRLLVAAENHMSGKGGASLLPTVSGRAAAARTWNLAVLNGTVHGMRFDLGAGPADPSDADTGPGQFNAVLLNPPFGQRNWRPARSRSQGPWPYGEPSPYRATFAWLQAAVEALAPGGLAAVVMPHSATTGSTARERSIRQSMVEHGVVRCVVALPGHLFRETTVPVTVWILAGPGTDPSHGVLLVDADAAARRESPTHRVLTGGGCQAVLDAFKGWSNGSPPPAVPIDAVSATAATVAEIRDHDYDLQPAVYLSERRRVTAEQRISERLSNLPAELAQLDAAARAADLALDRLLERLNLWTQ